MEQKLGCALKPICLFHPWKICTPGFSRSFCRRITWDAFWVISGSEHSIQMNRCLNMTAICRSSCSKQFHISRNVRRWSQLFDSSSRATVPFCVYGGTAPSRALLWRPERLWNILFSKIIRRRYEHGIPLSPHVLGGGSYVAREYAHSELLRVGVSWPRDAEMAPWQRKILERVVVCLRRKEMAPQLDTI